MDGIHQKIGSRLKQIRQMRGLSLDKVSDLTGVSKAMLGQIERGVSNPTVSILWKIANGLKVSFSYFVEEDEPAVTMVSLSGVSPIMESDGHYKVYPLFPFKPDRQFEVYTVQLDANSQQASEAHPPGVEEYIIVTEGELVLKVDHETYTIREGDAVRFFADRPHAYINTGTKPVRFHNLIYYPA
ncbi:MAG: helix-turn-helix transcriptional regulator [Bacillaceae bacterium]|nr:helix-turn-helix transcriptional regulator [Bacillaceae bacterium]